MKKHFGEETESDRDVFGVTHIRCRYGQADFKEERFESAIGGSDIYRAALLFSAERWGQVKVTGTSVHILACMAHGKELGLNVIPEGNKEGSGCLVLGFAAVAFCTAVLAGVILALFDILHGLEPLELGVGAAIAAGLIAYPLLKKLLASDAARAGQKYRDIFPEVHGSERNAARDAARRKGLL